MKLNPCSLRSATLAALFVTAALARPVSAQIWEYTYDGTDLPSPSEWNDIGGNVSGNFVQDGILTTTSTGYYGMLNSTTWSGDSGPGTTIEFRMRIAFEGSTSPSVPLSTAVYFDGGTTSYAFGANGTQVGNYSPIYNLFEIPDFDPSEFNIYRITYQPGQTAQVYLNNSTVAAFTLPAVTGAYQDNFYFAAPTGSVASDALTEWDYIRWTNSGTFAPVPEPSTVALLLSAGLAGWVLVRRRR